MVFRNTEHATSDEGPGSALSVLTYVQLLQYLLQVISKVSDVVIWTQDHKEFEFSAKYVLKFFEYDGRLRDATKVKLLQ